MVLPEMTLALLLLELGKEEQGQIAGIVRRRR